MWFSISDITKLQKTKRGMMANLEFEKTILKEVILKEQKNEITEHFVYRKLAQAAKEEKNKKVFNDIAKDEIRHYNFWKKFTKIDIKPEILRIWKFYVLALLLGITFSIKLMERKEKKAQENYKRLEKEIPDTKLIIADEEKHEKKLINLIDEERLKYISSMVLGLNDALVELTGVLAGLTFALAKTNLIAFTGLITGISASLSMSASEYLSTKTEETKRSKKSPLKASIYTGFMYLITVLFLILPYFIFKNVYLALTTTILVVIVAITIFTFFISITKELSFKKRFLEMFTISLGVALITFIIGYLVRILFNIEV